ncbi:MAG: iron ABC transporter permease [Spirochaetia bacterium]|nr:iron ABC transporter permease [Spirochaetia bacterium]
MHNRSSILYSSRFYRNLSAPALLILTFLFFIPLIIVLSRAFIDEKGRISLGLFISLLKDPYILRVFSFTIFQAAISTIGALIIGLPGAYLLANYQFRGKKIIKAISSIPFILPSILVVLGFVIFYGNKGILNSLLVAVFNLSEPPIKILYTFSAIILAHTFYNFPIVLSIVSSFWAQLPRQTALAAATLGATRRKIFTTITLPRLLPAILSASALVFLFCFSSFAIILVLGGGPKFTTIEVEIYQRARMMGEISSASALALLSIIIAIIILFFYLLTQQKMSNTEELESYRKNNDTLREIKKFRNKIVVIFYTFFTSIFVLGPLLSIVHRSFFSQASRSAPMSFSLNNYKKLFSPVSVTDGVALSSLIQSVAIAFIVSLISTIIGVMLSSRIASNERKNQLGLEMYAMVPMAVSSVVLGLGYYIISLFQIGINSYKIILVVLAHVVITSPFVLRSMLPSYRRIPFSYRQASLTLGASVKTTFFLIELPLLKGAIATSAAFAFAISMGEVNATLVLADSSITTLPLVLYRLIGSYNFATACALGTLLMVICLIMFFTVELIKKEE